MSKAQNIASQPLVSVWLKELERRVEHSELGIETAANYRNHFLRMINWLLSCCESGDPGGNLEQYLCDREAVKVRDYLVHLSKTYKPSALRTHLCSLRQAFSWLQHEYSTLGPEWIRKPEKETPKISKGVKDSKVKKVSAATVSCVDDQPISEEFEPLLEQWVRGMNSSGIELAEAREVLARFLCFVDTEVEIETPVSDELDAYRFILGLREKGPISRYIEDENAMPDWVLNSRVGYVLLSPKSVLTSFVAHTIDIGESFEIAYRVLLEFYGWASQEGASPFRETRISDILTEAWAKLQS